MESRLKIEHRMFWLRAFELNKPDLRRTQSCACVPWTTTKDQQNNPDETQKYGLCSLRLWYLRKK
jgi:hypothetical protein